jgi:methionyl-tRNA formyltransferase
LSSEKLRLVFMGTSELACASLRALRDSSDFEVLAVVTRPDRPRGRQLKPRPSPVKALAVDCGLAVLQPERARDAGFIEQLRGWRPDLIVVAAYGQLLPPSILTLPRHGCVNVHASLLPKYRGAAPIQWAILNDERQTGVTIMKMAEGLDCGDILSQQATAISPEDTAATLHDRLALMGADLLTVTLLRYAKAEISPRPQRDAEATYARKINKEDGRLDWASPARVLSNRIRAFTPWPGAFTYPPSVPKRLLKLWNATVEEDCSGPPGEILQAGKAGILVACGQGALRVQELQSEGGRRMSAAQFLAGHPLRAGDRIG